MTSKRMYDLERKYQGELIKRLRPLFLDCVILKNDPGYQQGIPDLVIFYNDRYGFLEVKAKMPTSPSDYEPNQEWFIEHLNSMSFASMICPENEEEVLEALQHALLAG